MAQMLIIWFSRKIQFEIFSPQLNLLIFDNVIIQVGKSTFQLYIVLNILTNDKKENCRTFWMYRTNNLKSLVI